MAFSKFQIFWFVPHCKLFKFMFGIFRSEYTYENNSKEFSNLFY